MLNKYDDIAEDIIKLKKKKNAIILSHYYQDSEIQDIADFIGDSLELSRKASKTNADIIVFCGVRFMAEAAYILNPDKKILLPDINAGCSLEESCSAKDFAIIRQKYADHIALTYINCSAEVKALSDIIVTSSNAEKIINSIPKDKKILFSPDKHLGKFLMKKTNRNMTLWEGSCVVHENFSERELIKLKNKYPDAKIIAHPECTENLLNYAEYIGSTSKLLNYTKENNGKNFIVLTEAGIIHQMKINAPDSQFFTVTMLNQAGCQICSNCPYMRLNTIEKLYNCLKNETPTISLEKSIAKKAKIALDRMLEFS